MPRGDPNEGGPAPDDDLVAYFSWYAGGFRVFDISDPANPAEVGHYIDPKATTSGAWPWPRTRTATGSSWPATGTSACSSSGTPGRCPPKGAGKDSALKRSIASRAGHPPARRSCRFGTGHLGLEARRVRMADLIRQVLGWEAVDTPISFGETADTAVLIDGGAREDGDRLVAPHVDTQANNRSVAESRLRSRACHSAGSSGRAVFHIRAERKPDRRIQVPSAFISDELAQGWLE